MASKLINNNMILSGALNARKYQSFYLAVLKNKGKVKTEFISDDPAYECLF